MNALKGHNSQINARIRMEYPRIVRGLPNGDTKRRGALIGCGRAKPDPKLAIMIYNVSIRDYESPVGFPLGSLSRSGVPDEEGGGDIFDGVSFTGHADGCDRVEEAGWD